MARKKRKRRDPKTSMQDLVFLLMCGQNKKKGRKGKEQSAPKKINNRVSLLMSGQPKQRERKEKRQIVLEKEEIGEQIQNCK